MWPCPLVAPSLAGDKTQGGTAVQDSVKSAVELHGLDSKIWAIETQKSVWAGEVREGILGDMGPIPCFEIKYLKKKPFPLLLFSATCTLSG